MESLELTRELQDFLYSYPVSSQLREAIFLDDNKESDSFEKFNKMFRTERETDISSKLNYDDYEQDKQTSFALAYSIISRFEEDEDHKTALDEIDSYSTHLFLNYGKQMTIKECFILYYAV